MSHTTIGLLPPISSARIFSGWSANGAVEREAGARRAGEQQPVDAGVRGQRLALVRAADHAAGCSPRARRRRDSSRPGTRPIAGVFSDGLNTTALPAISAGTMWPLGRCAGKLYGPSTASTPCGLCRSAMRAAHRRFDAALRGALGIGGDRDVDLGDDASRPRCALPTAACRSRARSGRRRRRRAGADDVGEAAQRLDPVGERPRGPARPSRRARRRPRRRRRRPRRATARAPVAGSVETISVGHGALYRRRSARLMPQVARSGQRRAHRADRGDLGVERRPVVALGRSRAQIASTSSISIEQGSPDQ